MSTSQMLPVAVIRCAPNPPAWSAQTRRVFKSSDMISAAGTYFSGLYRVPGTVAVAGPPDVPVVRKVRLLDTKSGRIVREVISDTAGNYIFESVAYGPWTVLSHDHTGTYNAVVADNRFGEPM